MHNTAFACLVLVLFSCPSPQQTGILNQKETLFTRDSHLRTILEQVATDTTETWDQRPFWLEKRPQRQIRDGDLLSSKRLGALPKVGL
jgi:hypothetical protein